MLNANITNAVQAAKSVDAGTGKVWAGVVGFCVEMSLTTENAKDEFKAQEKYYEDAHKIQPSTFPAYRSAKSVAITALKNGISLIDGEGKVRGKTEIEKANKDAKAETKTAWDKWLQSFERLNEQSNALMTEYEAVQAYGAVDKLRAKLGEMMNSLSREAA